MRALKMKCHEIFDRLWQCRRENERQRYRKKYYEKLAEKLGIPTASCHFGYFDMTLLKRAYEVLVSGTLNEGSRYG